MGLLLLEMHKVQLFPHLLVSVGTKKINLRIRTHVKFSLLKLLVVELYARVAGSDNKVSDHANEMNTGFG
ncbi:hypothetical protein Lal_00012948 [Lupinus albus]|nr:hypothetical protein Lal_00012948 [Lupinus albus]